MVRDYKGNIINVGSFVEGAVAEAVINRIKGNVTAIENGFIAIEGQQGWFHPGYYKVTA